MIDKIIKNVKWHRAKKRMKRVGSDCKIGLDFSVNGEKYICIGNSFRGGKHVIVDAIDKYNGYATGFVPQIDIGDNVTLTDYCYISCINKVQIGDGTLLGQNVFICDNFHGNGSKDEIEIIPARRKLYSKGPVIIGKNVWIGKNVCIMPGVTIGDNVIVGANSVVTHDIEQDSIAVGCPAKIIQSEG